MSGLFKKKLLNQKLTDYMIPDMDEKLGLIQQRHDAQTKGILATKTETECEQAFNDDIFKQVLGYVSFPSNPFTIDPKGRTQATGQKPDAILGYYDPEKKNTHENTQVVVEIKDAKTPLDKSQRREGNLSPIQQGFKYKPQYTNCKRVIATNFIEIRLFKDNQLDYEMWTLADLVNPENDYYQFKRFYYLLCADHLISTSGASRTEKLLSEVRIEQEAITKAFYMDYKQLRHRLIRDLTNRNPQISVMTIVEKAQKIIDRLIFVHFCEDLDLLPEGKLATNVSKATEVGFTPREMLKKFFHLVDVGSDQLEIPDGYNGGLFAPDALLDSLQVGDEICQEFIDLGQYDFSEDLSVNILGHIFEQSISDLEEIRYSLLEEKNSAKASDAKQSKRKKDGIFYTPEYIVDYIVKHSLGAWIEEQFETLKKKKFKQSKQMKDETYLAKEKELYREYQQILQNVKVLDPACGSGAFLVKVFDYLLEENVRAMHILSDGQEGLFDPYDMAKSILINNIFGVDLNAESVEITKLSLWLKTAKKGKKLASLDANIRCGNSLIDDPAIAGDKAFKREEEFADIMSAGGFDVIIGNPPYFNVQTFGVNSLDVNYLMSYYSDIWMDKSDILFYFFYKAIQLCKGKIAYITSNAFLFSHKAQKLRNYLIDNVSIDKIVNFEQYQIFQDASITSCVTIIDTLKKQKVTHALVFKERKYDQFELSFMINEDGYKTMLEKDQVFSLVDYRTAKLNDKIDAKSEYLGRVMKVGKGMETAANDIYTFAEKPLFPDSYLRRRLNGEAISRYYISDDYNDRLLYVDDHKNYKDLDVSVREYIKSNDQKLLSRATVKNEGRERRRYSRPMHKEFYHLNKLRCSYRSKSNQFVFDDTKKYIGLTNTTVIFGTNDDINLKYVLVLLNSQLLNRRYKSIGKQTGSGVFEYFENQISKLPIKKISLEDQQPFVERADQMLALNSQLHEQTQSALSLLQERYDLQKIPRKLQTFRELDFPTFKKTLKLKKLLITEEEELLTRFTDKHKSLQALQSEIDALDREIDEMVFDLYGLTDEERKIVLDG